MLFFAIGKPVRASVLQCASFALLSRTVIQRNKAAQKIRQLTAMLSYGTLRFQPKRPTSRRDEF